MIQKASLIFSLSWRNLWRNTRRTTVILIAIVLGAWAMIVMAAYVRGMSMQMFDNAVDNLLGHAQIHAPGYLDDPVIDHTVDTSSAEFSQAMSNQLVLASAMRVRVPAMITSERGSQGVVLLGIDPASEAAMSFIGKSVTEGRNLLGPDDTGIILGKKMAERLETAVGRRVVVMSQDIENKIADRGFRVVGIFDTMLDAQETAFAFVGLKTAQDLFHLGTRISEVSVKGPGIAQTDDLVHSLKTTMPALDVEPWYKLDVLSKLLQDTWQGTAFVWNLIVFLAMGFGIVNTILMAVFERTREFGLFQALGLRPGFILMQVWLEAFLLLVIGLAIGNVISWLSVLATGKGIDVSGFSRGMEMAKMSKIIPFVITFDDLLIANLTVLVLGLITCLYPAWRAARLVPAHAITRV